MSKYKNKYIPITPGGTVCFWLASDTEHDAWETLLANAVNMPYKTKNDLIKRGYTVEFFEEAPFDRG